LAGVAAATTGGTTSTQHEVLKIVARETSPAGATETTTYIASDRVRVETRLSSHVPAGATERHEYVQIRRCDLNTSFFLNPAERTYQVQPLQMGLSGLERFALSFAKAHNEPAREADLLVETTDPYCLIEGMGAAAIVPSGQNDGERTGNHLRNGIFLLAGGAARRGAALPVLDICDVAPTLLHLLGLPVQEDMGVGKLAPALGRE
jgi:hypothetical protein